MAKNRQDRSTRIGGGSVRSAGDGTRAGRSGGPRVSAETRQSVSASFTLKAKNAAKRAAESSLPTLRMSKRGSIPAVEPEPMALETLEADFGAGLATMEADFGAGLTDMEGFF